MNSQKHLFNLRPEDHYLNCAYKSPLLNSAEEAAVKSLIRGRNPMDIIDIDFFTDALRVKELFADLVGCEKDQVACIPSTSYGFSSALNNIVGKEGGNAITLKDEFPSGYFSLKKWCENNENEIRIVGPTDDLSEGESWNENVLNAIDEQTSIVLMSSIHWMNGIKYNLKEISRKCKKMDAKLIVDGSQSVGIAPMDVMDLGIDVLVCAGYKWMFGPYSMCLAYYSPEFNEGDPLEESWMNRDNATDFSQLMNYSAIYEAGAARFNVGEMSKLVVMPIMKEGLTQISKWGVGEMQNYCERLVSPLIEFSAEQGIQIEEDKYRSKHLMGLRLKSPDEAKELRSLLKQRRIAVSVRGDFVRVSVNVFNDAQDISALMEVLSKR